MFQGLGAESIILLQIDDKLPKKNPLLALPENKETLT